MRLSLLLAHPDPQSLNGALATAVREASEGAGHRVAFHDLAAEGFDPRPTAREIVEHRSDDPLVERHCRELADADGLILVHPNWFSGPPALLKGWVERVVRAGVAFRRASDGRIEPMLRADVALLITTANTRRREGEEDDLDHFWRDVVLAPCGVGRVERLAFAPVVASTPEERRAWLAEASDRVRTIFGTTRPAG